MIESIDIDPAGGVVNYAKFEGWWEGNITKGENGGWSGENSARGPICEPCQDMHPYTQQLNMYKQNKA